MIFVRFSRKGFGRSNKRRKNADRSLGGNARTDVVKLAENGDGL